MNATLRRHNPQPESLPSELRRLLAGVGLSAADTTERARAVGFVITPHGDDRATVEWFAAVATREAAAVEQHEARPCGPASRLHRDARRFMHQTIGSLAAAQDRYQVDVVLDEAVTVSRRPGGPAGGHGALSPAAPGPGPRLAPVRTAAAPSPQRGFLIDEDDN
ncbi:hypothetical protein [Streptomyces sp. NPDC051561]|uniref:hypothetical protein n=1 Tax=Streptomyces sp. NPDC051561 TaxID=3365658 RepID=UPI0037994722